MVGEPPIYHNFPMRLFHIFYYVYQNSFYHKQIGKQKAEQQFGLAFPAFIKTDWNS